MNKGKANSTIWIIGLILLVIFLGSKTDLFSLLGLAQLPATNGAIPVEIAGKLERCPGNSLQWYGNTASQGFGANRPPQAHLGLGYSLDGAGGINTYTKNSQIVAATDDEEIYENEEFKFNPNTGRAEYKLTGKINNFNCIINNYNLSETGMADCSFDLNSSADNLIALAFTATDVPGSRFIDLVDFRRPLDIFSIGHHTFTFTLPAETEKVDKSFFIVIASDKPAKMDESTNHEGCFINIHPQYTNMERFRYKVGEEPQQVQQAQSQQSQQQQTSGGGSSSSNESPVTTTATIPIIDKFSVNPWMILGILGIGILILFLLRKKS